MREIEVPLKSSRQLVRVARRVEDAAQFEGLTLTLKGGLAKYPRCIHWHFRRGDEPGTLEITYAPTEGRLWFTIRDDRAAPWMDDTIKRMCAKLQEGADDATSFDDDNET
jgi:hypothetical protein